MHDGVDLSCSRSTPATSVAVADVADDQRRAQHGLAKAVRQIIEHDHPLAARAQLQQHVAADIARAAGDQNGFWGHYVEASLQQARMGWK